VNLFLARIRLKGSPANQSILFGFDPTRDATVAARDEFYTELQQVSSFGNNYLITAEDFNTTVSSSDLTPAQVLGKFGLGHRCVNG